MTNQSAMYKYHKATTGNLKLKSEIYELEVQIDKLKEEKKEQALEYISLLGQLQDHFENIKEIESNAILNAINKLDSSCETPNGDEAFSRTILEECAEKIKMGEI